MAAHSDFASIDVDGERFDFWSSYSMDSDLLTPADGFRLKVEVGAKTARAMRDAMSVMLAKFNRGATVRLYIGRDVSGENSSRALQMSGIIDTADFRGDRSAGVTIELEGRDLAGLLVDSSVSLGVLGEGEMTLLDVVRAAVAPWRIEVITDGTAGRDLMTGRAQAQAADRLSTAEARAFGIPPEAWSRILRRRAERERRAADEVAGVPQSDSLRARTSNDLLPSDIERIKIKDAKPKPGETVWAFLSRHVARFGLMLWMDPRGKLVVSSPRYDTAPIARLVRRFQNDPADPNTIISGGRTVNYADRFSRVEVYGRTRGDDVRRSAISFTEIDFDWPLDYERLLIVHDDSARELAEAQRRAKRELRTRAQNADVLTYTLSDHGCAGYLYAIDSIVTVEDEVAGVSGNWYVTKRTFTKTRDDGTQTTVRLVPPGSLVL